MWSVGKLPSAEIAATCRSGKGRRCTGRRFSRQANRGHCVFKGNKAADPIPAYSQHQSRGQVTDVLDITAESAEDLRPGNEKPVGKKSPVNKSQVSNSEPTAEIVVGPCDEQVIAGLSALMETMVKLGGTQTSPLTSFHSVRPPAIPIADYAARIQKYFCCSSECFVLGLVYLDRLAKRARMPVTFLSAHRLLIVAMMIAAKFQDDVFYANSFYARVGGLQVAELNGLEREMLRLLDYRLFVSPAEFEIFRKMMNSAGEKKVFHV